MKIKVEGIWMDIYDSAIFENIILSKQFQNPIELWLVYDVDNATFNNISVISWGISFIGGGPRRKPPTCCKSLTNFITKCCTPRPD
jgi:hypothetical protein